jgi:hypothetical protein
VVINYMRVIGQFAGVIFPTRVYILIRFHSRLGALGS